MRSQRRERVTIGDLADRLGISKASVSYALNGRPGVGAETRRRVLELAEEVGFHASSAAVALSASRTGTIGIVVARDPQVITAEGFYMRTLFGVEQYLNEADGALLLRLTGENGEDLEVYRRWSRQGRVDGFLLFDEHEHDPRVALLRSMGMPCVVVTSIDREIGVGRLVTPELETVTLMLDHLGSLGHTGIGHVSGPMGYLHERLRAELLTREAQARDMRMTHVEGSYGYESAVVASRSLLGRRAEDRPTALILGNDIMATAALRTANDLGVPVPDELSIVAWDDSVLCDVARPRLTAIDHGLMARARIATELLFELIRGSGPLRRVAPVGTLLVRDSTGRVPRRVR